MTKYRVKLEIKKWIKEVIPVKPPRSWVGERRQVVGRRRQEPNRDERLPRDRREMDDRNQPRIMTYFTRIQDQNGNANMMTRNNNDEERHQGDDQLAEDVHGQVQHQALPLPQEEESQQRGRPPDIEFLRLP